MIAKHVMNKKIQSQRVDGALLLVMAKAVASKLNLVKPALNLEVVLPHPMGRSGWCVLRLKRTLLHLSCWDILWARSLPLWQLHFFIHTAWTMGLFDHQFGRKCEEFGPLREILNFCPTKIFNLSKCLLLLVAVRLLLLSQLCLVLFHRQDSTKFWPGHLAWPLRYEHHHCAALCHSFLFTCSRTIAKYYSKMKLFQMAQLYGWIGNIFKTLQSLFLRIFAHPTKLFLYSITGQLQPSTRIIFASWLFSVKHRLWNCIHHSSLLPRGTTPPQ